MKTAVVALVASLGAASAFAPTSSFNGASLTTVTRAAQGPQMIFSNSFKKPKPAATPAAPAAKGKAAPVKKVAAAVKSAPSKVAAPAKKAAAVVAKSAPVKKAAAAVKKAAAPVAAVSSGEFAVAFGSDVEAPFWDPAKLATDKPTETLEWYRAAELKHGRVAMLAALGTFVNAAGISLPDDVFSGTTRSFDALSKVAAERPGALIQIVLAIAAVEALTVQLPEGEFPGDLGFDPAKQIPVYESKGQFEALRLKELKNGRLAMVGIAGMWVQEALTGQGVFEQISAGHFSPVGDGQGYF